MSDKDDTLTFARALRDNGTPVPEIVKRLAITIGKNAGRHPSVASLYRALADIDEAPGQRSEVHSSSSSSPSRSSSAPVPSS